MLRNTLIFALAYRPALSLAQEPDQTQEREKPDPLVSTASKQATGTIKAISQSDRHVVLLLAGGSPLILEAGEGVRNFDQVRPGDRVVVSYHEGFIAWLPTEGQGVRSAAQAR